MASQSITGGINQSISSIAGIASGVAAGVLAKLGAKYLVNKFNNRTHAAKISADKNDNNKTGQEP